MHPTLQSTMMVLEDNMIRTFPIIQIEVKIRVPDQLMGRLIGKNGVGLKKIMDETASHISISDARQYEAQPYQTAEDRVITIRSGNWNAVIMAEKNVQQKLRQFLDQDMNITTGGGQQYYHGPGVIMNPVESIGPYIAPGSVPAQMLQRDNTYANASSYNALPMGISPQSFYIQNPAAAVANFSISTGHYGHGHAIQATVPSSVFIKSRVYVPNQIVGILIGPKGQNIKGIQLESGALINIEGDHPKKLIKKEAQIENNNKPESSSNNDDYGKEATPKSDATNIDGLNGLDMKSIANVESIMEKNGESETKTANDTFGSEDSAKNAIVEQENVQIVEERNQEELNKEEKKKMMAEHNEQQQQQEVNGSPQEHNNCAPGTHDSHHHQFNGDNKRNNAHYANNNSSHLQMNPDQRGVFIQGYEHQVNKALIWVYQKVAENQNARAEEITLTCEVVVPSKVIGRIIGRQGQNVKQLQQTSGAQIKVPDDVNQNDKVDAAVRVIGNVSAVQLVQNHFGRLIIEAEWRESKEFDERDRRSRYREGSR